MNSISLIGRLTKDPEIKHTQSGKKIATFTIAWNQRKSDVSHFFDCVAWEGTAGIIEQYCKKGEQIAIIGSLRQEKFETKDGQKRSTYKISVNELILLGSKKTESGAPESINVSKSSIAIGAESSDLPF